MLLDTHEVLYIWMGKLSSREDQRLSIKMAVEYLQSGLINNIFLYNSLICLFFLDPSGRDMNISVIYIKQEKEPITFVGFFPSWEKKFWKSYKSFTKLRQEIEMVNADVNGSTKNGYNEKSGHSDFDQYDKYPIDILKECNEKLPARIDPLNKEVCIVRKISRLY